MTLTAAATLAPHCEARVGFYPGDYGELPLWCSARIALTTWTDSQGREHRACRHHVVALKRRNPPTDESVMRAIHEEGEAIFRDLQRENDYFRAHENDPESAWCSEDGHAPGCPCQLGGDPVLIVGSFGGGIVTVDWSE